MPALKLTAYKTFVDLLIDYGKYDYCLHKLTDSTITYLPTNSFVAFVSIDNPERIKSSEWNIIFMEEATEFTYSDYITLKTRLSAATTTYTNAEGKEAPTKNKLILSFNPTSAHHWIKMRMIDGGDPCKEIVSNYKDNPFLSKQYVNTLEGLAELDDNFYRVFCLGEWGLLGHLVYNNYTILDTKPDVEEKVYGIDFGYNNPSAIVEVGISDQEFFVRQRLFQTEMTNQDLINWLNNSNINKSDYIYADSAEPARIEEISRHGYNIHPADKSVKDGIDFCKRSILYIDRNSSDLISELHSYSYKVDKEDKVVQDEAVVKYNDHLLDAMRYAMYTHFGNRKEFNLMTFTL